MKALINILRVTAILGLAMILLISVLYASDRLPADTYRNLLVVASLIWFAGIIVAVQARKKTKSKP